MLAALAVSSGRLSGSPSETRQALREWVRIESEISRETAVWTAEKEILKDRIALMESEKERLGTRIEEAEEGLDEVDIKRAEFSERRDELREAVAGLKDPLVVLERRIVELYERFPDPLKEETVRLFERIPKDGESTGLALTERLQAVVGLLNFADKFNGGVQREVEIRSIEGKQVEVETLYFGLAGAYFSDARGRYTGLGHPGPEGWEWRESPDAAKEIAALISVYNGTREAAFSAVPASLS
ncbi:MAG TPA: DUF3450 family protein, partial [Oceanipulchritudo sp.]|nr:DUF3450 family protein [Oceanipulchritudo sp.]